MNFIKDIVKGICIGAGAILPGISSGVLCVIFGIYDKLVDSVLGIFKNFKKNFIFLLPLGIGVIIGIVLLGNMLNFLFEKYSVPTQYAFIGLILGSIPILVKQLNNKNQFKKNYLFFTIISFLVGICAVILESYISSNFTSGTILIESLYQNQIPSIFSIVFLVIAGFFMSIGIVVPGISSTLILMCFGIYSLYLEAIATMNISILIPLAIGVLLGGFVFLKLIRFLLDKYYMPTFYSIIGFTLGSVLVLYTPLAFDFTGVISILLFAVCFYIAQLFERKAN